MACLTLERVCKSFGSRRVVDATSVTVADGELLAILGPSGAGKTTLLRAIAGLERIDGGRITLGELDITDAAPRERNVGFVFQDYALFPHLTVRANIGFGVRADRARRVAEIAERLGIAPLLDRYPARLSGGERQRVAIARALAIEPAVLLFDEPFASLDAPLRAQLRAEIADVRAQAAMPTIFVTHDQDEALALGDRVAVVRAGRVVADATPADLLSAPPTTFVASFVGHPPANVLAGQTAGGRFTAELSAAIVCDGVPQRTRAIAVRPEQVRVTSPESPVVGRVRFVETIGTQRYATLAVDGVTVIALAQPATRTGERVGLAFAIERPWTYDDAGNRCG